ncbi:hypothetical protein D9M73_105170 [compost metagenome]
MRETRRFRSSRDRPVVTSLKMSAAPIGLTIEKSAGNAKRKAPIALSAGIGLKSIHHLSGKQIARMRAARLTALPQDRSAPRTRAHGLAFVNHSVGGGFAKPLVVSVRSTTRHTMALCEAAEMTAALSVAGKLEMKTSLDRIRPVDAGHLSRAALLQRLSPSISFELAQIAAALSIENAAATRWRARPTPDVEEARNAERRAIAQITRAANLMRDVAALSAPCRPEITEVSISEMVGQSIALARHALHQARASVRIGLPDALAAVRADRVLAQQILLELLLHAAAGSKPRKDPCVLEVEAHRDGDRVHISICHAGTTGRLPIAPPAELESIALQAGGKLDAATSKGVAFGLSFPVIGDAANSLGEPAEPGLSAGARSARSRA